MEQVYKYGRPAFSMKGKQPGGTQIEIKGMRGILGWGLRFKGAGLEK